MISELLEVTFRHGPKLGSHEAEAFTKLEAEAKAFTHINLEAEAEARLYVLHSSAKETHHKRMHCKVEALVNHEAEAFESHEAEARLPKI